MSDVKNNIAIISKIFEKDKKRSIFKKHIDYIRFPFFKNFESDLKINFDFPVTFLVGQNGSGKSSLLQALFGAPKGKSIASYWYTTELDPIKNLDDNRHCFIYSFRAKNTRKQVEVLKERIQRRDRVTRKINPDYWEPSRPKISYGMPKFPQKSDKRDSSKTRWNLLENDVLYMDFRYSLSAYDKYFYFGVKPTSDNKYLKSKQDIIRKYASRLKTSFDTNSKTSFCSRKSDIPITLEKGEISVIEKIY